MDCYDEILKLSNCKNFKDNYIGYLADLINKKSKSLTGLQFRNCLLLTLAIWNPIFFDSYFRKGEELKQTDKNTKEQIKKVLKAELKDAGI